MHAIVASFALLSVGLSGCGGGGGGTTAPTPGPGTPSPTAPTTPAPTPPPAPISDDEWSVVRGDYLKAVETQNSIALIALVNVRNWGITTWFRGMQPAPMYPTVSDLEGLSELDDLVVTDNGKIEFGVVSDSEIGDRYVWGAWKNQTLPSTAVITILAIFDEAGQIVDIFRSQWMRTQGKPFIVNPDLVSEPEGRITDAIFNNPSKDRCDNMAAQINQNDFFEFSTQFATDAGLPSVVTVYDTSIGDSGTNYKVFDGTDNFLALWNSYIKGDWVGPGDDLDTATCRVGHQRTQTYSYMTRSDYDRTYGLTCFVLRLSQPANLISRMHCTFIPNVFNSSSASSQSMLGLQI